MLLDSLREGHRALAVVLMLMEREKPAELLQYYNPADRTPIAESIREIETLDRGRMNKILRDEMRRLLLESKKTPLHEIHSDWILQALLAESPEMIATILRHMPGEHVRWILDHLPPKILGAMPRLTQTFSIDPKLVQILRRKFESRFPKVAARRRAKAGLDFSNLGILPLESLEILFRELGFRDLALAFATLGEKWVQLIFRRLSPRDAELLRVHIENKPRVSEERLARAQSHVLSLDLKGSNPEQLILEAGFFVFSKALLPEHLEGVLLMARKFPVSAGMQLEKYVRHNSELNTAKTVIRYQKEINEMIQSVLAGNLSKPKKESPSEAPQT